LPQHKGNSFNRTTEILFPSRKYHLRVRRNSHKQPQNTRTISEAEVNNFDPNLTTREQLQNYFYEKTKTSMMFTGRKNSELELYLEPDYQTTEIYRPVNLLTIKTA